MPAFTDRKGRTWNLELDLLTARQIDASDFSEVAPDFQFSILNPERALFAKLLTNAGFLFAVIWVMVQDQAETLFNAGTFPVSPKEDLPAAEREFISGVNGSTVIAARKAMTECIADFFPEQKTVLSIIQRQQEKAIQKLAEKEEKLEMLLNAEIEATLEEGIERTEAKLKATRNVRLGETSLLLPPTVESPTKASSDQATPYVI